MNRLSKLFAAAAVAIAACPANAERVYVKARGEVELAPFRCENVPRGANVKRLCYDAEEKYVLVSLKGIWYHFCGVPPETVTAWRKSASKGRYYNDNIRGNFDCSELHAPAYR
jgi:hypothetical protein